MYLLKFWITGLLIYPFYLVLFLSLSPIYSVQFSVTLNYVLPVFMLAYMSLPTIFISMAFYQVFATRIKSILALKAVLVAVVVCSLVCTFYFLPDSSLLKPGSNLFQSILALAMSFLTSALVFNVGSREAPRPIDFKTFRKRLFKTSIILFWIAVLLTNLIPFFSVWNWYHYTTQDGEFTFDQFDAKQRNLKMMDRRWASYMEKNPKDTVLYRTFAINPLKFWEWRQYIFSRKYRYPYLNPDKVRVKDM